MSLLTKIQTVQFEPDWSKAPDNAVSAVAHLAWVTKTGNWLVGYEIASFEKPVTPHPHAEEDLKRLEKRCPLRCDFSQAMKDLKREPLSDDEVIVPEWMIAQDERQSFVIGVRFAEKMHGI